MVWLRRGQSFSTQGPTCFFGFGLRILLSLPSFLRNPGSPTLHKLYGLQLPEFTTSSCLFAFWNAFFRDSDVRLGQEVSSVNVSGCCPFYSILGMPLGFGYSSQRSMRMQDKLSATDPRKRARATLSSKPQNLLDQARF